MSRPVLEVAEIIRRHGAAFLEASGADLTPEQRRTLRDLVRCRTAALGGHVEQCDHCGQTQIAYNSCRNRHCPKCQAGAAAHWVEAQAADLLPVDYFHVVFTLPAVLNPLALAHPRVVYDLLFRAAVATLRQVAADPKHLGAAIGGLAVLHTWGQTLQYHPHLHCVVPGGGLAPDGSRWIACPRGFFLPVRVLSRVFRGKFLAALGEAFDRGRLVVPGSSGPRADAPAFARMLAAAAATEWVVYAKEPFGGPEAVLKYLARYTHRVAISNTRLVSLEAGRVTFRYKDYAHHGRERTMSLEAGEFLRRFLQHVLPSGFVRVRHFGFLANGVRRAKVGLCRELLAVAPSAVASAGAGGVAVGPAGASAVAVCPRCGVGRLLVVREVPPERVAREGGSRPMACVDFDSS